MRWIGLILGAGVLLAGREANAEDTTVKVHLYSAGIAAVNVGASLYNISAISDNKRDRQPVIFGYVAGLLTVAAGSIFLALHTSVPDSRKEDAALGWGITFLALGSTNILISGIRHLDSDVMASNITRAPAIAGAGVRLGGSF